MLKKIKGESVVFCAYLLKSKAQKTAIYFTVFFYLLKGFKKIVKQSLNSIEKKLIFIF